MVEAALLFSITATVGEPLNTGSLRATAPHPEHTFIQPVVAAFHLYLCYLVDAALLWLRIPAAPQVHACHHLKNNRAFVSSGFFSFPYCLIWNNFACFCFLGGFEAAARPPNQITRRRRRLLKVLRPNGSDTTRASTLLTCHS